MNVRDLRHALLPETSVEQRSRQTAVVALRRLLNTRVRPRNLEAYGAEAEPAFVEAHGRPPQSPDEVQQAFLLSPSYRRWSATNRAAQEMIWVAVGEPIYADQERMTTCARQLRDADAGLGSLTLDPHYTPSPEVADVDIHLQPGGYGMDNGPQDAVAGALYECGGNVFSFGQGTGKGDSKAAVVFRLLDERFDGFRPTKVLELGCSAGAAAAAYADHFPDAKVHAIDIGAGMLRYAHARSRSLGVAVHFHQMDASRLGFKDGPGFKDGLGSEDGPGSQDGPGFGDGGFDLVVSHNLLHEIGGEKRRAAFREAWRVLRPGGVIVHLDVPIRNSPTLVHRVERNWDTLFNGEAHWNTYATADLVADMLAAGCEEVDEHDLAAIQGPIRWYAVSARKRK